MFEKLENWIRATTKHIDKLGEELYDLRSEVRSQDPMYGSLWYNQKFEMVEDTDFLD